MHIITSMVQKDTLVYVLCCTVMDLSLCIAFCIVLCCTSDYSTVLYCTILYFTVLYCICIASLVLYYCFTARDSLAPQSHQTQP